MKNFFLTLILIAAIAAVLQFFLPWWVIAIVAFAVAYFIPQKSFAAFGAGFLAVFLLWIAYAFMLSSANENILAIKVAELLKPLTGGKIAALYLITGRSDACRQFPALCCRWLPLTD